MIARALVLAFPLIVACRMAPEDADVAGMRLTADAAPPAAPPHGAATGIRAAAGGINQFICSQRTAPERVTRAGGAGVEPPENPCRAVSSETLDAFATRISGRSDVAAAVVAEATLDPRVNASRVVATDHDFDQALAGAYGRLGRAALHAGELALPQDALISVPFSGISLSPAFDFSAYAAATVVHIAAQGAACGARIVGVNAGPAPHLLEPATSIGSGLYAAPSFHVIQVVLAQTVFDVGDCGVSVTANSGGASARGFDAVGERTCTAAQDGALCSASPVTDACLNAGGDALFCGDCSALCSVPVASALGEGGWQTVGFAFYGGGYAPAVDVAVVPRRSLREARLGSLDQCPGTRMLAMRLLPSADGAAGAVGAVSVTLDGPLQFGECQIPVLVR